MAFISLKKNNNLCWSCAVWWNIPDLWWLSGQHGFDSSLRRVFFPFCRFCRYKVPKSQKINKSKLKEFSSESQSMHLHSLKQFIYETLCNYRKWHAGFTKESIALFSFSYGNINFWWELDSLASLEVWMNKPQRHKGHEWMCFCVSAIQSRWQPHSTRAPRFSHRAPLKGNGDGREFSVSSVRPFLFLIIQTVLLSHSDRFQIQMQRDSYSRAGFSLREGERLILFQKVSVKQVC